MNYDWIKDLKDLHKYKFLCAINENEKLIIDMLKDGLPVTITVKKMMITFLQIEDIKKVNNLLLQEK